jgi:hypothetical protein
MKTEPKLSYSQLRQILSLTISNTTLKAKLEDFLSGKVLEKIEKLLVILYNLIILGLINYRF